MMLTNGLLAPEKAPDKPEIVTIRFEAGVPVAVNGKKMAPLALIEEVNKIAGRNGVGRIDHIEDRIVGIEITRSLRVPSSNSYFGSPQRPRKNGYDPPSGSL